MGTHCVFYENSLVILVFGLRNTFHLYGDKNGKIPHRKINLFLQNIVTYLFTVVCNLKLFSIEGNKKIMFSIELFGPI